MADSSSFRYSCGLGGIVSCDLASLLEINPIDDALGSCVSFHYRFGKGAYLRTLSGSLRPKEEGLLDALWIRPAAASFSPAPYLSSILELTDNQYIFS